MITISPSVTIAGAHVRCIVYAPRTDVHRELTKIVCMRLMRGC